MDKIAARANLLNALRLSVKAITPDAYEMALQANITAYYDDKKSRDDFIKAMLALIAWYLLMAWQDGMEDNDLDPRTQQSELWSTILQGEIDGEARHVSDLADAIAQARATNAGVGSFQQRARLWRNRFNDIVNLSRLTTGLDHRFEWQYGDTDHCDTCFNLNGVIATGRDWLESGFRPQNPPNELLECGGWYCQCEFVRTSDPVTPGGIPYV